MSQNSIMIQQYLQTMLKKFTARNIKEPNTRLQELNALVIEVNDQDQNREQQQENQNSAEQEKKQRKNKILNEIKQKQLSLESFWRCLFLKMQYIDNQDLKKQFYDKLGQNILKGECLELIDGENLEFKAEIVKELFKSIESVKNSSIFTIAIIGKQSSGKSTLMNFCFGTQFMTSQGRCTSGVYLNIQKLPDKILHEDRCIEYILILDTEGLQSPDRNDSEFDRMITTFALLNSNLLICNSQGNFDAGMKSMLQICTTCLHEVKQNIVSPQIYFSFGFNRIQDDSVDLFLTQLLDMYDQVVSASPDLRETAKVLKVGHDQIFVLGWGFETRTVQMSERRNIGNNIEISVVSSEFSKKASSLAKYVLEYMKEDIKHASKDKYKELMLWSNESSNNWNVIDSFAPVILRNERLEDIRHRNLMKIQYQQGQKEISDNVDVNSKVKAVLDTYRQMIIVEDEFRYSIYFDNFRTYLDQIYEQAKNKYIENWILSNPGVCRSIVTWGEQQLIQQIQLYQKIMETQLTQKMVELQINNKKVTGIMSIKQLQFQIKADNSLNQLKQNDQSEYDRQVKLRYDEQWSNEVEKIKRVMRNDQMILKQYEIIYHQYKMKQSQMVGLSIVNLNESMFRNTDEFTLGLITQKQCINGEMFDVNIKSLQFVELDLKQRLFNSQYQENYVNIKKFFNKFNCYNCVDLEMSLRIYRQDICESLVRQIFRLYKMQKKKRNMDQNDLIEHQIEECYNLEYKQLKHLVEQFNRSGFQFRIYKYNQERDEYFRYIMVSDFDVDMCSIYSFFDTSENTQQSDLIIKYQYTNSGYFSKDLEKFIVPYKFYFNSRMNISSGHYQRCQEMVRILRNSGRNISENALFIYNGEQYKRDIRVMAKYPDLFGNIETFNRYLNTVIDLNNPQQLTLDRKTDLCNFVEKMVNWPKLLGNIKREITEVMKVDQIVLNNRDVMFHQIDKDKCDQIYQDVIKKEIDLLNNELSQICGVYLTIEIQGLITYCGIVFIVEQLRNMQNLKIDNQLKEFNKTKDDQWEVFQIHLCGRNSEISQANAQEMTRNVFQTIMKQKRTTKLEQVIRELESPEFTENYSFKKNYEKMLIDVQTYSVDEIIKYFENPTSYYQEKMAQKEAGLNSYINKYQDILKAEGKFVLQESKKQVKIFQSRLASFNYQDVNILDFFQFYKNREQINLKEFENQEILNISGRLLKMYMDILFLEISYDESENYEMKFEINNGQQIDSDSYKIHMKDHFRQIYKIYYDETGGRNIVNEKQLLKKFRDSYYEENSQYQVVGLMAMVEGIIKEINKIEVEIENYEFTGYQNDQLDNLKKKLIKKMKGCNYSCRFCRCQCQVGYHHDESVEKHSCDKYGHNLRVFAGGMFSMDEQEYPSLQICNTIPSNHTVKINDQQKTWTEVQQNKQSYFEITYSDTYKKRQELLVDIWQSIGREYCNQKGLQYIENSDIEYHSTLFWSESLHIIFCLDISWSLSTNQQIKIKSGAADLLKKIQNQHKDQTQCRASVINFGGDAIEHYSDNIYGKKINQKSMFGEYKKYGTDFEKAFKKVHELLEKHYNSYKNHRIIFFTDGEGDTPTQSIDNIISLMQSGSKSLKVNLYAVKQRTTESLLQILNRLNSARNNMCKLEHNVNPEEFKQKIVEIFHLR